MAPGARSMFGAPMFETEVFRKQLYCIEESTSDTVGTFRHPHSDPARGELCPSFPTRYAPAYKHKIQLPSCPLLRRLSENLTWATKPHWKNIGTAPLDYLDGWRLQLIPGQACCLCWKESFINAGSCLPRFWDDPMTKIEQSDSKKTWQSTLDVVVVSGIRRVDPEAFAEFQATVL